MLRFKPEECTLYTIWVCLLSYVSKNKSMLFGLEIIFQQISTLKFEVILYFINIVFQSFKDASSQIGFCWIWPSGYKELGNEMLTDGICDCQ